MPGLLGDASTEAAFSVASAWELALKVGAGRMELPGAIERYLPDRCITMASAAAIGLDHVFRADRSTHPWRPFDRLLVAQAQVEGIPILTADPAIGRYDVETIW